MTRPRIITEYEWPEVPFPGKGFWRAWRDGNEEAGVYGQGATETEAIADLMEQEDDE